MSLYVCIMAGGLGKRMKSTLPKVLHPVNGIPMLVRVINEALSLVPKPVKILAIVGEYRKIIQETIEKWIPDEASKVEYIIQPIAKGTGHAMQCTLPYLTEKVQTVDKNAHILVLSGDVPLLSHQTLTEFINTTQTCDAVLISQTLENPYGRGRVFTTESGEFLKIVEEKDCTPDEALIKESNCGIYLFKVGPLIQALPLLHDNNAQKEFYLTDVPKILKDLGQSKITVWNLPKEKEYEMMNINCPEDLNRANDFLKNNQI